MSRHTRWYGVAHDQQVAWKQTTGALPDEARGDGHCVVEKYGRTELVGPYPICLPVAHAEHNLLPEIREEALERFQRHRIAWHMATDEGRPSTHLLDSQLQCVNVLLSLARAPQIMLQVARHAVPDAANLVPIEDGNPVAFEWIGREDYLGEARGRARERGRYATSADALMVVAREDGGKTGLVVEWKFTEFYPEPVAARGPGGRDRRDIYRPMYEAEGSPFAERPEIGAFLQEPHYQLLRLALLAGAMVDAEEFGIDRAVLVHFVPSRNEDLLRRVPAGLRPLGDTVDQVWGHLLRGPRVCYQMLDTLPLMKILPPLQERYGGLSVA